MITKPERIIKRIIKAIGKTQAVLLIGDWHEDLIKGIKENQNTITQSSKPSMLFSGLIRGSSQNIDSGNLLDSCLHRNDKVFEDNSFTRIIADYNSSIFNNDNFFFNEVRRLLLPTGMIIISANCEAWIFEKIFSFFKKNNNKEYAKIKKIKSKTLQNQIHDHGFLIDGYYGYPGGHLLMMAQIQNKEVTTLFSSDEQKTIKLGT